MPSAVLSTTPDVSSDPLADIKRLAAEGYFQAIAYWLNHDLVPQQVYAQVLEDEQPGRLKILIEFEREPQPERLLRFVCNRLYKLRSDVIQGAYLIVRPLGTGVTRWEKSVRIPTATERQPKNARSLQSIATRKRTATRPGSLIHESALAQSARRIIRKQFNFFRAALVTGTAAIALAFGGLTELVVAGKLLPSAQSPEVVETPWYVSDSEDDFIAADSAPLALGSLGLSNSAAEMAETMAVSFRPASRFQGRTVEAALETIAVVPHDNVADPTNPTITLLFGGELGLNDFIFEDASSIDNLFSDIELYQEADISMIGLAEPLANASTSLQEDFYHRTRPQAVNMLKAGGIDIVSLASEGTLTYGSHGLDETLNTLDRQGIYRVGAGRNQQEAHRPEILEVKGQRIAYLGYNPDAIKEAKAEKAGVAIASNEERAHIIEDIRAIRSQVDWVVVNYRWGEALDALEEASQDAKTKADDSPQITTSQPADWQRSLAREAVDAGADLVVGYHPSHIQGAEIYRDRAIAYSLGDFVFDQSPLQDHDTAALRVSLRNQKMKVEFLPIIIRDSKLQMAEGDRALSILKTIRNASKKFEQPMRFPTVLKAKPNLKLPDALRHQPSNADYPSAPNSPTSAPEASVNPPKPFIEVPSETPLAPHPLMKESDALFAPEADSETPDRDSDINAPYPEKIEDIPNRDVLDRKSLQPSEAIPAYPNAIQSETIPPETFRPPAYEPELEPEGAESNDLDANSRYPAVEIESVEPFVDPFLDPTYDSSPEALAESEATNSVEYSPDTGAIEPYAEPLVGPISALPAALADPRYANPEPAIVEQTIEQAVEQSVALEEGASTEAEYSPPRPKVFND